MSKSILSLSTTLVNFIKADSGDKLAAADLRLQVITGHIVKAFKGNATEYRAGQELARGLKTKHGKAWAAGFAALAQAIGSDKGPARWAYTGTCTPAIVADIEAAAAPLSLVFAAAFEAIAPTTKPEPTEADKVAAAERKAKAEADRKAKALSMAAEAGMLDAESHAAELAQAREQAAARALADVDLITSVVNAIHAGQISADDMDLLRVALSLAPKAKAARTPKAAPAPAAEAAMA